MVGQEAQTTSASIWAGTWLLLLSTGQNKLQGHKLHCSSQVGSRQPQQSVSMPFVDYLPTLSGARCLPSGNLHETLCSLTALAAQSIFYHTMIPLSCASSTAFSPNTLCPPDVSPAWHEDFLMFPFLRIDRQPTGRQLAAAGGRRVLEDIPA